MVTPTFSGHASVPTLSQFRRFVVGLTQVGDSRTDVPCVPSSPELADKTISATAAAAAAVAVEN